MDCPVSCTRLSGADLFLGLELLVGDAPDCTANKLGKQGHAGMERLEDDGHAQWIVVEALTQHAHVHNDVQLPSVQHL
eukprot:CAMPEP_0117667974 /NCGR_PEP_ID=MMETSP0804-20121206/11272_1 /TAXON_ID=1074897 /ORGANISM="Tetraselmis astigmatica, Strain CCMP880" /LENGTH=77 /DNA_ID=CAMNT_0005475775 /DNA_START=515 /DNA_END=748 /DNA_ORIENTATION=-